jgi:thioredoxin 1
MYSCGSPAVICERNRKIKGMNTTGIKRFRNFVLLCAIAAAVAANQRAAAQSNDSSTAFAPLDQWRDAILAGDAASLKSIYSVDPVAQVMANGVKTTADADASFWLGLKAQSIPLEIVAVIDRPKGKSVVFKADVHLANGQTLSVTDGQMWRRQGEQWRLISVERADAPHLKQPSDMKRNIYPPDADAHAQLKEAEEKAAIQNKRVLLVFGANWCYDCHVLDLAFHRPDFAEAMAGFEVVHVDLGDDEKKNADLVKQFDIPLDKGIPALAVADSSGKLIVSQRNGEFEDARSLTPEALLEFLNKWKPSTGTGGSR